MIFCTYCGKSFTRKEHLERHIPSHTNVKPHRCSACQLSFARRDLLQRHHSTYHEARDPLEPLPGGIPTVAGRTPIACLNCAQAKTGCDKRVPCARCADKNLPCAARFARRSSKAALRAAQTTAAFNSQLMSPTQQATQASYMDIDQQLAGQDSPPIKSPGAPEHMAQSPMRKQSPANSHPGSEEFPSPHARMDNLDEFMPLANDFVAQDTNYQDLLVWPDYPLDLDVYSNTIPLARPDLPMPAFEGLSDISSGSEPMTSSSSRGSIHTRGTSIMSNGEYDSAVKPMEASLSSSGDNMIPEFDVVIATEAAWPLARCNPPIYSGNCPRTGIVHLECLEQKSKQDGAWSSMEAFLDRMDWNAPDLASVVPITQRTRDRMLAITQSFLHKALEIHRGGVNSYSKPGYASPGDFNFLVLPPSKILEYFLRSYVRSLGAYYSLVVAGQVDPNEMLGNSHASTLLVLLMIAQGATGVPMAEARYLTAGLTETCRISLFDIIEKDVELSADPVALRCALLFTLLGAWSGDKWLMDIAMGQRGMYLSMLRHAGMLDPQPPMIPTFTNSSNIELQWRTWLHRESQNRLVYNWVMVDQELSLFHDTVPMLAITDLQCPLPGPEILWMAKSSEQWLAGVQSIYGRTANVNPQLLSNSTWTPSLSTLFEDFLNDNLARRQATLSPQQLRLLLHPLQALLCHLRQMLTCFGNTTLTAAGIGRPHGSTTRSVATKASTLARLEEVQGLLQRWYELTVAYLKTNPTCPVTRCNLVLYHLISLNAVSNFPEIERLARREPVVGHSSADPGAAVPSFWDLALRYKHCIFQREEAIFHCGQVLRLVRAMPADRRPCWWSAALYRATLILWTDSIARLDPNFPRPPRADDSTAASSHPLVAIDQVLPEDPLVISYLWSAEGVPVLTRRDGSRVGLDKPADVLTYTVKAIDEGLSTRIGDGIKRKLVELGRNWNVEALGVATV